MGPRKKYVYQDGVLKDALFGNVVRHWNVQRYLFDPGTYRVRLETSEGEVILAEDEEAFWIEENGERQEICAGRVRLPDFAGCHRAPLLRALHAELLVNILPWGPVPNLWVYSRPWYRDAAMMALCFERTGNVGLLQPWIEGLRSPYDYNNSGIAEADNLGQALYLASLIGDERQALVEATLKEIPRFRTGRHICGQTDFAERPVYQTKWLKYGLRRLGLDDTYEIPTEADAYSSLFWMDFRDQHIEHPRFDREHLEFYPYLHWAEAHFYGDPPPENVSERTFPLTREVQASQADYSRMTLLSSAWTALQWSSPHTWHAAEMFLYFLDHPER